MNSTRTTYTVVESPLGPATLVAESGTLSALLLADADGSPAAAVGVRDERGFDAAAEQLAQYFAGERTAFDLPLHPAGTPFQMQVWRG